MANHTTSSGHPMLDIGLVLLVALSGWYGDMISYIDMILGIVSKSVSILGFITLLIINYKTIIANVKDIYKSLRYGKSE